MLSVEFNRYRLSVLSELIFAGKFFGEIRFFHRVFSTRISFNST